MKNEILYDLYLIVEFYLDIFSFVILLLTKTFILLFGAIQYLILVFAENCKPFKEYLFPHLTPFFMLSLYALRGVYVEYKSIYNPSYYKIYSKNSF